MKHHFTTLLLFLLCSFSCTTGNKDKAEIAQLVAAWQGKEILFPPTMIFTRNAVDTIDWQLPATDYKIVVFADSIGCVSCKLQLPRWKQLMESMDTIAPGNVSFLFVLQSKDLKEIRYILRRDKFDYPVCVDVNDRFNHLNHFSTHPSFQTFLLDNKNKVVVIGNPVHNPAIKDLYLKQITGKETSPANSIRTTGSLAEPEINLGTFPVSESKRASFTLTNTGNQPLVILDAATTCNCATVSFDKEPAPHGTSLQIHIDMTPKSPGFFNETITLKCNTPQPYKLKIRGQAT